MNRALRLLGLCACLVGSPVSAQAPGAALAEAALLTEPTFSPWAQCIEHRVHGAMLAPRAPAAVVAGAFEACRSDEQKLTETITARLGADKATTVLAATRASLSRYHADAVQFSRLRATMRRQPARNGSLQAAQ